MPALEPAFHHFPNPVLRYLAATRPAFLSITLIACLIGLASAHFSGLPLQVDRALATIFFALVAHAGVNVINDYYDFMSGADVVNTGRIYPFTGGSRFIPNGVISARRMKIFGYTLLLAVIPAGLWLTRVSSEGLFWIGLAGLFAGWAYCAPPMKLVCRGLGEPAILAGWALIAVGADFVQRGGFSALPWLAGVPFALLVVNILYINQFPDRAADAAAGKRTLIVRLGPEAARWGYLLIAFLAYGWLLFATAKNWLPLYAAAGALALPFSLLAARALLAHASTPSLLAPALKRTILAANISGLSTTLGLWFSA
ncbi:MAG: prenyltransferase [Zoogloeaceae bacterium]|jgi:1,4-dihydroxy-2-naphthoate octaprenyltransferase|nr:prenyltransferase [Zoogloeaceae bacterium]